MTRKVASAALDHGEGTVIVDALKILGFDAVPVDIGMGVTPHRYGADQILDEDGIIIRALGDVFFVRPLEEGKDFRAGTGFDESDKVLDPDGF